jgi:hypothetical protein
LEDDRKDDVAGTKSLVSTEYCSCTSNARSTESIYKAFCTIKSVLDIVNCTVFIKEIFSRVCHKSQLTRKKNSEILSKHSSTPHRWTFICDKRKWKDLYGIF